MKCPACGESDINPVSKPLLLFGLSVRCKSCGSDSNLGPAWSFVAKFLIGMAVLASLYSSIYLNLGILYLVVALAFFSLLLVSIFLPVQARQVRGMRRRREERMKRTIK